MLKHKSINWIVSKLIFKAQFFIRLDVCAAKPGLKCPICKFDSSSRDGIFKVMIRSVIITTVAIISSVLRDVPQAGL